MKWEKKENAKNRNSNAAPLNLTSAGVNKFWDYVTK